MQEGKQDRCKRQTILYQFLPPFISANLTIFKQFTTYSLCISCVLRTVTEDCCTAFYHQIKNSFSYHELSPERPLYNHQLCSTVRDWDVFFCSFFHTDLFAVMLWEINHGLILVPGYRQEGAAWVVQLKTSTLNHCHLKAESTWGMTKIKALVSMLLAYDCSCLTILFALLWTSPQNTEFRRHCCHSKTHWFPSISWDPSWCFSHLVPSVTINI